MTVPTALDELGSAYAAAWSEWDAEDGLLWEAITGDGISHA